MFFFVCVFVFFNIGSSSVAYLSWNSSCIPSLPRTCGSHSASAFQVNAEIAGQLLNYSFWPDENSTEYYIVINAEGFYFFFNK